MWHERTVLVDPSLRPWRFELGLVLEFQRCLHTDQVGGAVTDVEFFAANWYQQGGWDGNWEDDEPKNKSIFYHYAVDSRETAHWTVKESFRSMLSHLPWN